MKNIMDLLDSEGHDLVRPFNFGRFAGKFLWEIDPSDLQGEYGVDAAVFIKKTSAALRVKEKYERHVPPPPDWLYDHQKESYYRYYNRNYGGIFFEMGAGKTATMLAIIDSRIKSGMFGVWLVPKTAIRSIVSQCEEKFPRIKAVPVTGTAAQKRKALDQSAEIYVTNYETLLNEDFVEKSKGATFIVFDEVQRVKNHQAKTTRRAIQLSDIIPVRFALSGTPFANAKEAWSVLRVLDRGRRLGKYFRWYDNEFLIKDKFNRRELRDGKRIHLLRSIAEVSTRVKKEHCLDLPEKIFQEYEVEMSEEEKKYYRDLQDMALLAIEDETKPIEFKLQELIYLRMLTGGTLSFENDAEERIRKELDSSKLEALRDLLDSLNKQAVVVGYFVDQLLRIDRVLDLKTGLLYGGLSTKERDKAIDDFIAGRTDVLIMQIQAGGTGLDGLQLAADTMISYSLNYSYFDQNQVDDRIHRPGQKHHAHYIRMLSTIDGGTTIDHAMNYAVKDKTKEAAELVSLVRHYM